MKIERLFPSCLSQLWDTQLAVNEEDDKLLSIGFTESLNFHVFEKSKEEEQQNVT